MFELTGLGGEAVFPVCFFVPKAVTRDVDNEWLMDDEKATDLNFTMLRIGSVKSDLCQVKVDTVTDQAFSTKSVSPCEITTRRPHHVSP